MSSQYIIQGTKVIFSSGTEIQFKYNVRSEILEYEGILILTLEVPQNGDWLLDAQSDDFNRNIFGLDIKNERLLWQIEPNVKLHGNYHSPQRAIGDPDDIFLWGHPDILINPYNGKLIKIIQRRSVWD